MATKLSWAEVCVSAHPRVRFFVKTNETQVKFRDVTKEVSKIVIEDLEDGSGYCALLRLNAEGQLVWQTKHPSLQEAKWHVEFEYGLPEEQWLPCAQPGGQTDSQP
ncbi:MAG: hypothetical protein ABSE73_01060 [Planctomycetota bacterium]